MRGFRIRALLFCAALLLSATPAIHSQSTTWKESVVYSFPTATIQDGGLPGPYAGLVQASDGNLWGTSYSTGANGYGEIFKITPLGYGYGRLRLYPAPPTARTRELQD